MDKSKWEYKKLGEVANCQIGLTYKPTDVVDDGGTIVLRSSNIQENKIALDDIVRVNCNINPSKYVNDGDILMCSRNGSFRLVGKVAKIKNLAEPMSYGAFMTIIRSIYNDFLFYFFLSHSFRKQIFVGQTATINQITTKMLNNISMALPPIADQQRIVAELDCLNEMIALKQEQLKEFDKLAQSIFYDMFGDPISNSKKWETIKLEKITKAEGGGTPSKNNPDYWGGEIAWVTSKDMKQMYISDSQIHITEAGVNNSPAHILPKGTILLVNRSGILKHTLPLALTTKEVTINQDLKALTITDERFLSLFVLYTLKGFAPYLLSRVKAVTVDSIEFSVFKKLEIPLPPLALQQQFAEKIQAIEAQKELVKQSIAETQHLLDSRMDYYFD